MKRLVALSSGSAAEERTWSEPRYRQWLAGVAYTGGEAGAADAWDGHAGGVWVPEGTPRRRLRKLAPRLEEVLARGGAVFLFGDQQAGWPASVRWTWRPAGGAGQTSLPTEALGFADHVGDAAVALHHHGVLAPPPGADVLLAAADGAAVAYLDRHSTPGSVFVSTLDPLAHFGTTATPESARFLDVFIPWAAETLLSRSH
ncbi:MAG: hypothetical protein ACRDY7_04605 [Acidimicrobiia bacterium]